MSIISAIGSVWWRNGRNVRIVFVGLIEASNGILEDVHFLLECGVPERAGM